MIEHFQGSAAGIDLVVMARSGKASRMRNSSSFQAPRRIFTLPARHGERSGPNRVRLSPLCGAGETVKPHQMKCLALAGLPWVLAEPDADPVAVAPDGIEQQCEVTIKEGMLHETILIIVVDKSATIAVNSYTRLGSLSG